MGHHLLDINAILHHNNPPDPGAGITPAPGNILPGASFNPADDDNDNAELLPGEPLYITGKQVAPRGLQCKTCRSFDVKMDKNEQGSMVVKCGNCGTRATDYNQGLFRAVAIRQGSKDRGQGSEGPSEPPNELNKLNKSNELKKENIMSRGKIDLKDLLKPTDALWANIAVRCKDKGITTKNLATSAQTSTSTIHYIKTCRANITRAVLSRIAAALDTTVEELIKEPPELVRPDNITDEKPETSIRSEQMQKFEPPTIEVAVKFPEYQHAVKSLECYELVNDSRKATIALNAAGFLLYATINGMAREWSYDDWMYLGNVAKEIQRLAKAPELHER